MPDLMKKNEKVLAFEMKEGVPSKIITIYNKELLPISLQKNCDLKLFVEWFEKRKLPPNREGLEPIINRFGTEWTKSKNYASLTDQYWVRNMSETWKKINFFTNTYSLDIGDLMFFPWQSPKKRYRTNSPDLMTNGRVKKRWIQNKELTSYLIKAENKRLHQEPINEILTSIMLEQLELIPYVRYDLHIEGIEICSKCKNFITASTEFVSMGELFFSVPKMDSTSTYDHLLAVVDKFKIPYGKEYIDNIIFVDRLCGNNDRHLGNMGVIADVEQCKILYPAPLFDSGNAFWEITSIYGNIPKDSKLFGDVDKKIFKEVKKRCNLEKLLLDENMEKFEKFVYSYPKMSDKKRENLINAIKKRNEKLCMED